MRSMGNRMKKFMILIVVFIVAITCRIYLMKNDDSMSEKSLNNEIYENKNNTIKKDEKKEIKLDDWRITLVNYENILPEEYEIELANIDNIRQFDKRAIDELFAMMRALKTNGIYNIWVQSSYRSVKRQTEIFEEKTKKYMLQGNSREEAEELTLQTINKPGTSDHNLGLAVDFNYVDYAFEELKGFKWLQENAENYGFILRYRKDKETITKVNYEPWHWRYVGVEHAKKINELDMCLEEYVEYLKQKETT